MAYSSEQRKKNMVFQGTMCFSLLVHMCLFVHISKFYSSEPPVVLELTMKDVSKPFVRSIPRPRVRTSAPQVRDIKKQVVRERKIAPMNIPRNETKVVSPVSQAISAPEVPDLSTLQQGTVAGMVPFESMEAPSDYITSKEYFDMMRIKIEGNKLYPENARHLHQEGKVRVYFVIDQHGEVVSLKIIKGCRYKALNRAALKAVKKSAPFPKPPSSIFKGDLKLELTIHFELT